MLQQISFKEMYSRLANPPEGRMFFGWQCLSVRCGQEGTAMHAVASITLPRRIAAGEPVEITDANRPGFRELATARIIEFCHAFAGGDESGYRWTYWGWNRRFELSRCDETSALSTPAASLRETVSSDRPTFVISRLSEVPTLATRTA